MEKGIWSKIKWVCMHGHDEPVPMVVMHGSTPFRACPRYMLKDDKHPDGHGVDERACANRLSPYDEAGIVELISADMGEALYSGDVLDLTNARYYYNGIDVTVLRHTDKEIILGVTNRGALR